MSACVCEESVYVCYIKFTGVCRVVVKGNRSKNKENCLSQEIFPQLNRKTRKIKYNMKLLSGKYNDPTNTQTRSYNIDIRAHSIHVGI